MKKPKWVVEKEQGKKVERDATVWLFGLHAVRDALMNSSRIKLRLIITLNAQIKLTEAIDYAGIIPDVLMLVVSRRQLILDLCIKVLLLKLSL